MPSAKNYLLSQDRAGVRTAPAANAQGPRLVPGGNPGGQPRRAGRPSGLVRAPLNDGTGDGVWAFNQAYFYAGIDVLGQALEQYRTSARARSASTRPDPSASRSSGPSRPRRCGRRWSNFATTPGAPTCPARRSRRARLMEQWYPTDVDTGAVHLLRLKALPAAGALADCLLHDHEDNLFLNGWGMANEPVYNQQATAYLLRDDPKAVIRAFYSMMACAFSHSVLEPVEHRWTWGQYFGPPSTDGAWFELYRNMLIHELDDGSLLLFQATPRSWLEDGKRIEIERAPTYYGKLSASVQSRAASGEIRAEVDTQFSRNPKTLIVRFRHPQGKPMRSATVNGENWTAIDREKESVIIANPTRPRYSIVVQY